LKFTNEFVVAVSLERVWETLLDIESVAGFLPGATIEPSDEEGVYNGTMKVKVGPMSVNYKGTARLARTDEAEHVAEIAVEAVDTKGQGTATATISNRVVADDAGSTRVIAETNLSITGRQAQFGRGIMQDVAQRMLDDFAKRFEAHLLGTDGAGDATGTAAGAGAGGSQTAPPPPGDDVLDMGSVLWRTPAVQRAGLAALGGIVIVLLVVLRRSRSE
jgi:hypothetical protein